MIADLAPLLVHTVTLEPWSSQDGYGKPAYGAAVTYAARVVGRNRMVRDDQGREVVSSKQVQLGQKVSVSTKDRITLPAGEVLQQPPIVAVGDSPDELGESYTVVYLA